MRVFDFWSEAIGLNFEFLLNASEIDCLVLDLHTPLTMPALSLMLLNNLPKPKNWNEQRIYPSCETILPSPSQSFVSCDAYVPHFLNSNSSFTVFTFWMELTFEMGPTFKTGLSCCKILCKERSATKVPSLRQVNFGALKLVAILQKNENVSLPVFSFSAPCLRLVTDPIYILELLNKDLKFWKFSWGLNHFAL